MYSWRGGGAGVQLEREGRSWCTAGEGGWSWCTVREGGQGRSWCTVREGGEELVYSWRGRVELVYS